MALTTASFLDNALLEVLERRRRGDQGHNLTWVLRGAIDATMASIILSVKIDRSDPTLLHDQVAGEIRRAIADGEAKTGERLPPARDLAAVLGVNTNTVLRALRMLRDEGLLEFRRGHGVRVAGTPQRGAVLAKANELVKFARQHGYRREELLEIIQSLP
jgi:GntR family transcriptional regulator